MRGSLSGRRAKLAQRLPHFSAEEARKVRGIREAKSESNLLHRHVPKDEIALRLGDDACVEWSRCG
jgi:hypothetical protein